MVGPNEGGHIGPREKRPGADGDPLRLPGWRGQEVVEAICSGMVAQLGDGLDCEPSSLRGMISSFVAQFPDIKAEVVLPEMVAFFGEISKLGYNPGLLLFYVVRQVVAIDGPQAQPAQILRDLTLTVEAVHRECPGKQWVVDASAIDGSLWPTYDPRKYLVELVRFAARYCDETRTHEDRIFWDIRPAIAAFGSDFEPGQHFPILGQIYSAVSRRGGDGNTALSTIVPALRKISGSGSEYSCLLEELAEPLGEFYSVVDGDPLFGTFEPNFTGALESLGATFRPARDLPRLSQLVTGLAGCDISVDCSLGMILPPVIAAIPNWDAKKHLDVVVAALVPLATAVQSGDGHVIRALDTHLPDVLRSLPPQCDVTEALPRIVDLCQGLVGLGLDLNDFLGSILPTAIRCIGDRFVAKAHLPAMRDGIQEISERRRKVSAQEGMAELDLVKIIGRIGSQFDPKIHLEQMAVYYAEQAAQDSLSTLVWKSDAMSPASEVIWGLPKADVFNLVKQAQDRGVFGFSAVVEAMAYLLGTPSPKIAAQQLRLLPDFILFFKESPDRALLAARYVGSILKKLDGKPADLGVITTAIGRVRLGTLPYTFLDRASKYASPISLLQVGIAAEPPPAVQVTIEARNIGFVPTEGLTGLLALLSDSSVENLLRPTMPMRSIFNITRHRLINLGYSFGEYTAVTRRVPSLGGSLFTSVVGVVGKNSRLIGGPGYPGTFTEVDGLAGRGAEYDQLRFLIGQRFYAIYDPAIANVGLLVFNDHFEQDDRGIRCSYLFAGDRYGELVQFIEQGDSAKNLGSLARQLGPVAALLDQTSIATDEQIEATSRLTWRWADFQREYAKEMQARAGLPEGSKEVPLYDWFCKILNQAEASDKFAFGPSHKIWGAQHAPEGQRYYNRRGVAWHDLRGVPAKEFLAPVAPLVFNGTPADRALFMEMAAAMMPGESYPAMVDLRYVNPALGGI